MYVCVFPDKLHILDSVAGRILSYVRRQISSRALFPAQMETFIFLYPDLATRAGKKKHITIIIINKFKKKKKKNHAPVDCNQMQPPQKKLSA